MLDFSFSVPVLLQTAPTGSGCLKLDEKTENWMTLILLGIGLNGSGLYCAYYSDKSKRIKGDLRC